MNISFFKGRIARVTQNTSFYEIVLFVEDKTKIRVIINKKIVNFFDVKVDNILFLEAHAANKFDRKKGVLRTFFIADNVTVIHYASDKKRGVFVNKEKMNKIFDDIARENKYYDKK